MNAVVLAAEWAPRDGFAPTAADERDRRARRGSAVWRAPSMRVERRADPSPAADEVVIAVRACGICGSDVHLWERDADGYMLYPGMVTTPVVTGHEFAGTVVAAGADVVDVRVGEPVCAEEIAWCGECRACRAGLPNNCIRLEELGFTFDGAHAELVRVRARNCWSLLPLAETGIDEQRLFRSGALVEPTAVAYVGMFVSAGGFMPGSTLGVAGAGPIGLAAIALARAAGASRVLAFEPSAVRRELALAVGADEALDPRELGATGIEDVALRATRGLGLDRWVEASGAPGVVEPMTRTLAPGGRLVLLGRGPHTIDLDPERLIVPGASIHGSIGHAGSAAFGRVIALMAAGRVDLIPTITASVGLDGVVPALAAAAGRDSGKTMLELAGPSPSA